MRGEGKRKETDKKREGEKICVQVFVCKKIGREQGEGGGGWGGGGCKRERERREREREREYESFISSHPHHVYCTEQQSLERVSSLAQRWIIQK